MELELVVDESPLKVGPKLEAGQNLGVHLGFEEPITALAVSLGDVHRGVGVADQLIGVDRSRLVDHRDAEACLDEDLLAVEVERLVQELDDPLSHVCSILWPGGLLEQDRELVATEAGRRVGGTNARGQPLGHLQKNLVPGRMSEAVVDRLEIVQVEEDDRDTGVLTPRPDKGMADPLVEQRAVGQVGHRVVERLALQLFLELLTLADVAPVQDDSPNRRIVKEIRVEDLEMASASIT